jgi:tetratricopeptide (TPR) repeat protein
MAIVLAREPWRLRARRAATLIAGIALVTLPIAVKNARDPHGSFQLQGHGGLNVYIGNSPAGSGMASYRLGSGWDTLAGEAARSGVADGNGEDRYYVLKTLREIASRPAAWLRLVAEKAVWSVQSDEIRDSLSFAFFADAVPLLRWLPGFGLLFPLAIAGAFAVAPGRRMPLELAGWIVAMWVTIVLLVVGLRYRIPLVPPLCILAGAGAVALWARLLTRQMMLPVAVIVAVLLSHAWLHAPSHVLAEEWAFTGTALNLDRRLAEAESAYLRALALDDRSALAWKGLGIVLYNTNRLEESRAAHQRALSIDPDFADACLRLAFTEGRLGRLDEAVKLLRRGAAILPNDIAIRRALGQHLFATGDYRGAARELEWVLSRNPSDQAVLDMLGDARRRLE